MNGFLGTRAGLLIDIMVVAQFLLIPALYYSIRYARQGQYHKHKTAQIWISILMGIAILAFEIYARLSGGLVLWAKSSSYSGTNILSYSFFIHLFFAITTVLIWIWLLIVSLKKFDATPQPGEFSKKHRFFGQLLLVGLFITCVTDLNLYIIVFAL